MHTWSTVRQTRRVFSAKYHLIWCPKYRRGVLVGKVEARVAGLIRELCAEHQVDVLGLEIMADHVHLLAEIPPGLGLSRFMQVLRDRSSRLLYQELPHLRRMPALWSPSWFVATVGGAPLSVILIRAWIGSPRSHRARHSRANITLGSVAINARFNKGVRREPEARLMGRYKTTGTRKRKREKGAPTHIANVPLDPSPADLSLALTRNRAGLRLYNAVLAEAKKRSRAAKADPAWEQAQKMAKGKTGSPERVRRSQAFQAVREAHSFTRAAILSFGSSLRRSFMREQVFAQEAQELSARAFDATFMWHVARRGEPRVRRVRDGLHSLSCKDLNGSMRPVVEDGKITALQWGKATHISVSKPKTRDEEIERERIEALVSTAKLLYCRVVFEQVRGRVLLYLQLVLDGPAPLRHQIGEGKVSFDLGPSTVHVVSEHAPAFHEVLAPSVQDKAKELRRALSHLDRQHRAGSPECFDEQRRHVRGRCYWRERSTAAEATKNRIAELHRTMAEGRDRDHGNLVNRLYALGDELCCEGLNYVACRLSRNVGWPTNRPTFRRSRDRFSVNYESVIRESSAVAEQVHRGRHAAR